MYKNFLITGLAGVLLGLFWTCAAVKPPSGGPVDKTPPRLVSADPPGETRNFQGGKITLTFSEYMREESLPAGIRLTPRPQGDLTLRYLGDRVVVRIPPGLDPDQTYVLTLSREVRDEHDNRLEIPVQLAYSTGDRIDQGSISGQVYYEGGGVAVQLWNLDQIRNPDSVLISPPQYVTDAGDDGAYEFRYLKPGRYRALALDRKGAGRALDPRRTPYGLTWQREIVVAADSTVTGMDMRLWQEPAPLKLSKGTWYHTRWGRITFNNPLQPSKPFTRLFLPQEPQGLPARSFPDPLDPQSLVVISPGPLAGEKLRLEVRDLTDIHLQSLDSAGIELKIPATSDTAGVELVKPAGSVKVLAGSPGLDFLFSKPLRSFKPDSLFAAVKTDTTAVPLQMDSLSPLQVRIVPRDGWEADQNYTLALTLKSLQALDGTRCRQALQTIRVSVAPPPGSGGVLGRVLTPERSPCVVQLRGTEKAGKVYLADVNSEAEFRFHDLPEGTYRLMVFEDRDRDRRYQYGRAFPYLPSEWFYVYPDSIEVRAMWDTDLSVIEAFRRK